MPKKGYIYDGTQWVQVSSPPARAQTIYYQDTAPTGTLNTGDMWVDSDENTLGDVLLTDSVSSTSTTTAATPNSVKTAYDLANAAVPKSTVTTAGDLIYGTGSAAVSRLALGTAGKVLTVNAGATAPEWATAASGGGMTLIATATPSAATTISFTSIPNTYKNLMVVWSLRQSVNNQSFFIRFNNDTGNNYYGALAYIRGNQAVTADTLDNDRIGSSYDINWNPVGMTGTGATDYVQHSNGVMAIYRYTDTTQATWSYNSKSYTSATNQSGYSSRDAIGIYRTSGTAIDRIDFVRTSTQTVTGTVYLYGVS